MKKMIISFGNDENKEVDPPFTVVPCILPDNEKSILVLQDGRLPEVFYCFSDLVSFFEQMFPF